MVHKGERIRRGNSGGISRNVIKQESRNVEKPGE